MTPNELADYLLNFIMMIEDYDESKHEKASTMLRQQQAEIDFLKKEILEKHEDWKHEGQQAANARAEIDALKAKDLKKSMAIRSLNTQLKKALQYETFNR